MTTVPARSTVVLRGLGVSPGQVVGPVARMHTPPVAPLDAAAGADPEAELARVGDVLALVAHDLEERAARAEGAARAVLEATAQMARDRALLRRAAALLREGRPTARAVTEAFDSFAQLLAGAGEYMAGRIADLNDVRDRAVALLLGVAMPGLPNPGHPFVLVAGDLSPADTAGLVPGEVLALVTEGGGPSSHTAILAKSLGMPAVVALPGAADLIDGDVVAVDGSTGVVVRDPDDTLRARATTATAQRAQRAASSRGPGHCRDGHAVALCVNVGTAADARRAAGVPSEGVGLFRTEFLFLGRRDAPSEAEQEATYREVLEAFAGRRVTVRTLDAGSDKPLPFVFTGAEDNPALGVRGLRVARAHPDLLDVQLSALAAAAAATGADVRVMAPMVSTEAEAAAFADQVHAAGLPSAGVMIEVPAAALRAARLFDHPGVDFASLGTNDLAQYTMAADRTIGALADLLDPWQPAVLDLVAAAGEAGSATGTPVGVCGEAAGDPLLACVLVGSGITSLSTAPGVLADVRLALAAHDLVTCRAMAVAARAAYGPEAAREAVRSLADPALLAELGV